MLRCVAVVCYCVVTPRVAARFMAASLEVVRRQNLYIHNKFTSITNDQLHNLVFGIPPHTHYLILSKLHMYISLNCCKICTKGPFTYEIHTPLWGRGIS